MKPKKLSVIFYPDRKLMEIDGKKFKPKIQKIKLIDGIHHTEKIIFEEIDENKELERIGFIKSKLIDKVPIERIIEEMLKDMDISQIDKLERLLKKKAEVKRHDGCLGIKIDGGKHNNMYLQLYD